MFHARIETDIRGFQPRIDMIVFQSYATDVQNIKVGDRVCGNHPPNLPRKEAFLLEFLKCHLCTQTGRV